MKRYLHVFFVLIISLLPGLGFATHIVGGTLNYVYNGGSSYTITLKLFRDCTPGTASFPGSVTVSVLGYDGKPFSPSRDITMTLSSVTPVPSNLPPCAQQPSPMPCTQQGLYTTTVNNLPPNPGGYHLYYQLVARNLSLTNVSAACNCVGESFYAYIPGPSMNWYEDFTFSNGTTVDNGTTSWSTTNGATPPASASVNSNIFQVTGANNSSVTWASQVINISSITGGANMSVDLTENGTLENDDSIHVYYSLNGGPLIPFSTNGAIADDFGNAIASQSGVVGSTIQIFIVVHYGSSSPASEIYSWDNVAVWGNNFVQNSNPVFTLFPPLFLCVNTPFTFDHSATDADGDSLVYEFYTPYNGDNGVGPLDPTFSNNTANFTPIVFLGGYSTTSPLGGTPLTLNSSTGLLSGTPTILGQFVVGILVKEYRNGVYLSSTLRDFQFNVVNCPQTLAVSIGPQNPTICFGQTSTTITANATGGTAPYSYLWNTSNPTQSINVGVGTYSVTVTDAAGCQVFAFVTVTSYTSNITANAGADQTKCKTNPVAALNGIITGASGGYWSGGHGTYSPDTTTMVNMAYTPSAAELSSGFVNLVLATTGNGACPAAMDTVKINYLPFTGTVNATPTAISCFGGGNGSITANVVGGSSPYTYSWNTSPIQTTSTINNLGLGTYTVTVTDAIGCTSTQTATITQPALLAVTTSVSGVSCNGGTITASPTGGNAPYTYLWQPGGQTTAVAGGLPTGTYTVTVTDSKGCQATATTTINPPPPVSVSVNGTNVSCFGGNNGTATTTAGGGTSPFTYSWSPGGATSSAVTGLTAGNYTVTVTDHSSCTATATITITEPTALSASTTVTAETCDYLNNGTATVTASGGTAGYTYQWLPGGQTGATASSLSSGSYTVNVTDSKGCITTAFATVTQPSPLTVSISSQTNVNCNGGSNGSATAVASGGTAAYTYNWMPGNQAGTTYSGLSFGTYTVTATDNHSCTAQTTVTISQPTLALSVSISKTDITCNGSTNGTATANPTGGTAPYTYLWNTGGQTTATISNLAPGIHSCTVTDSKGCTANSSVIISQPAIIDIVLTSNNVSCFSGSNGSITSTVTGGTSPYSYLWSPGGYTTPSISGLTTGIYTLTVTDANGCVKTKTRILYQPAPLSATITKTNETCDYSDDGTASLTVSGGTPGYTYLWQPGNYTTASISGIGAGSYTATATDNNGCIITKVTAITQPNPLTINFSNQVNVSCFGGTNASLTASGTGGTPNYTYSWAPGSLSGANQSGLSAGTYTVSITDSKSCVGQNTVTITQPAAALTVTAGSTPVTCYGGTNGTASATPSGGTSPYISYVWMPGNVVGQNISNIASGIYTVTLTDNNQCTATNTVSVTQASQITTTITTSSSSCGLANGSATVSASGGAGGYTYQWSPTGGTGATTIPVVSGTYSVLVTDASGCTTIASENVNDDSGPSASIFATTNVSCYGGNDGTATVGVVGGTGTLTYTWLPSGGNGPVATGLTAGTYTVSVVDDNGCQSLATTSPPITQPPNITMNISTVSVDCFGGNTGAASVIASGGTGALSYLWMPGNTTGTSASNLSSGTYTLQITDANNCVRSQVFSISQPALPLTTTLSATPALCNGESTGTASSSVSGGTTPYNYVWMPGTISGENVAGLPAGTYTLNVMDAKGCTTSNSITVSEPAALSLTMSTSNSTCGNSNGTANVSVSGGTSAYSYFWTPGGEVLSGITGVSAGNYSVDVTDANGCEATSSVIINNTAGPVVTITSNTNVSCNGANDATATTSVSGGTGAISYSWSPTGGTSNIGTGLGSGEYVVTVTDQNGCQSSDTSAVITEPSALSVNVTITSVDCFGNLTGGASAAADGGIPPYSYIWLPNNFAGANISGIAAGVYTVQVTDANNCVDSNSITITQPSAALSASVSASQVLCFGESNGTASATVTGGTAPYAYSWAPTGGVAGSVNNLVAGNYTVSVTDANGCSTSGSVNVSQPSQALSLAGSNGAVSCFGGSNGSAFVTPSGGTPSYTYSWSPTGGNGQTATGLSQGNYTINVTDANLCTATTILTITQPTALSGSLSTVNETCTASNGQVNAQVSGGTIPYAYSWSNGATATATINNLSAGTYSVLITDAMGCTQSLNTALSNTAGPAGSVSATTDVSCFGGADGSVTMNASGGTPPYFVQWLPSGGNNNTITGVSAGTYSAVITDAIGCVDTGAIATINEPQPLNINLDSITNVLCNGGTSGTATVSASGGTPSYTYNWAPSNTGSPVLSGAGAGTYTVTVSDQHNCSTAISLQLTQPLPLSSALISSTNPVCNGETGNATATASGGTIPYDYSWSSNPLQTGSTLDSVLAGSYTCTITDVNGCVASTTVIISQPSAIITTAGPDAIICLGNSATLTASASGGSGGYFYTWVSPAQIDGGSYVITPNTSGTYTVTAYDQNGCAGSVDTVKATVYDLNPASIDLVGDTLICIGYSSAIFVQVNGNPGPLTYSWNFGFGNSPGAFLVTPTVPTTYVVTVSNSCGAVVKDSLKVQFNPPPTIVMSGDTNAICVPGAIDFANTTVSGNPSDPIISWLWNFGDGSTSTLQTPSHTYFSPGSYNVSLTATTQGGCTNNNVSAPFTVFASPFPNAAFTINSPNLNLPFDQLSCANQSTGATSYSWNFGDGSTSTLTSPTHAYTAVGNYTVQLIATSSLGCADTAYQTLVTDADVVFPNVFSPNATGPNGGSYNSGSPNNTVFFPFVSGVTEYKMQIFNRWGELIFESNDVNIGWDGYYRGKLCQQDVYIYKVFLKLNNGKEFSKTGDVTLLQ